MYPLITIGSTTIDVTGLGIIAGVLTFLIIAYYLSRKASIQFIKLFYRLPLPLILTYLLSTYISFMVRHGSLIPTNTTEIMQRLSPHGYHLHIAGIIISISIAIRLFLKQMPARHERRIWINILATSIAVSLIPLGIGLLLGNHFVGLPTASIRGVETFRPDISTRNDYGSVYPVGLMISILGILGFIIQRLGQGRSDSSSQGYLTLAIMVFGISIINIFANSAKYLVIQLGSIRRDSVVYLCIGIAVILLQQYMIENHRHQHKNQ